MLLSTPSLLLDIYISTKTMVSLSLDGSSLSRQQVLEELLRVKNEGTPTSTTEDDSTSAEYTDELSLMEVELDADQIEAFVDVIRFRMMIVDSSTKKIPQWKAIHIHQCSGLVNDAILACTTATNVRELAVRQPTINPQTIHCLTYGLKYNHQLQSLKLAIRLDAASSRSLSTAVARNTTLHELSLENCTNFEEPGVVMNISFGLRLNQHLERLSLDSCYLSDEQVSTILMALDGHNSIKKLSLQRNSCHTQGMTAIATLLHGDLLEELDLSFLVRKTKEEREREEEEERKDEAGEKDSKDEESDEKTADKEDGKDIADEDAKPAAVEKNEEKGGDDEEPDKLEEEENEDNGEIQVRNTNLRVLLLAGNGVGDAYLESVMNIFGKESKLETLSLFGNRLSSEGIRKLILKQKLPYLKQLKRLYLGHNTFFKPLDIKDDLIQALKKNYSLEEVMIKSLLNPDAESNALQELMDHYCRMNVYGRRIMACFEDDAKEGEDKSVPLGLWARVLGRANRMQEKAMEDDDDGNDLKSFGADAIFCLLHGPVLYENPNLAPASPTADKKSYVSEVEEEGQEGCTIA